MEPVNQKANVYLAIGFIFILFGAPIAMLFGDDNNLFKVVSILCSVIGAGFLGASIAINAKISKKK